MQIMLLMLIVLLCIAAYVRRLPYADRIYTITVTLPAAVLALLTYIFLASKHARIALALQNNTLTPFWVESALGAAIASVAAPIYAFFVMVFEPLMAGSKVLWIFLLSDAAVPYEVALVVLIGILLFGKTTARRSKVALRTAKRKVRERLRATGNHPPAYRPPREYASAYQTTRTIKTHFSVRAIVQKTFLFLLFPAAFIAFIGISYWVLITLAAA